MINTAAAVVSAVKAAEPGETIYLDPISADNPDGSYSLIKLYNVAKDTVRIDCQDASVRDLSIEACSGLQFNNALVELSPNDWVTVQKSADIGFYGCQIIAADRAEDFCVKVVDSSHVSFSHCDFQGARTGVSSNGAKGLVMEYCRFHDLGQNGFHGWGERIAMVKCFLTLMRPPKDAHPDTFQMWVEAEPGWYDDGKGPADIRVADCLFLRGDGGGPFQGPFLQDDTKATPFSNVAFERNYVLGGSYNALNLQHGQAIYRGNTCATWAYTGEFGDKPDLEAIIRNLEVGGSLVVEGNRAQGYGGFETEPPGGNAMMGEVTDQGEALAREYLDRNPDMVAVVGAIEV